MREIEIRLFWDWWRKKGRESVRAEVAAGRTRTLDRLDREVGYLDRGMRYDVGPGSVAVHRLTLRPLSDPRRRRIARTWLASAPPPDATWEYAIDRPSQPVTGTIELATVDGAPALIEDIRDYLHLDDDEEFLAALEEGVDEDDASEDEAIARFLEKSGIDLKVEKVALADVRTRPTWDPEIERFDIAFWHPAFASISRDEADEIGGPAITAFLGDEAVARWLGEVSVDPEVGDGLDFPALRAWIDARTREATGDRWVTARRRGVGGRHVAIRFNAARKPMDDPISTDGLQAVLYRTVSDVEAQEPAEVVAALRDLTSHLAPGADRLVEVSEDWRLTIIWFSSDRKADLRAARTWRKRHRAFEPEVEVDRDPRWIRQMRLEEMRPYRGDWANAPLIKTRPDGRLYRRALWIVRHPRRMLMTPVFLAIGAILLSVVVPSLARDAGLLLIGVAGVEGLALAAYSGASTYVTFKNNPALGVLALLIDGWKILTILAFSIVLILVYIDGYLSR